MSTSVPELKHLLEADKLFKAKSLLDDVMTDIVLFDGDVPTQQINRVADVAKAIVALKDKTSFTANVTNQKYYDNQEILNFILEQRVELEKLAAKLAELGENDLAELMGKLGTVLYASAWKPDLLVDVEQVIKANESNKVILYKGRNGELAIRFKNQEERDKFYKSIPQAEIPAQFRIGAQYTSNPKGLTPVIYEGQNNQVFFPSYQARKGEFAINCGNQQIRDALIQFLGLRLTNTKYYSDRQGFEYANGLFTTYSKSTQLNAIYFNQTNLIFTTPGAFLKIDTSIGVVSQHQVRKFDELTAIPLQRSRMAFLKENKDALLETSTASEINKPAYRFLLSDSTWEKIKQYKKDLITGKLEPGAYLKTKLSDKDSTMTDEVFIECLLQTKRYQIFAEATVFSGEKNWNATEVALLGDISCIMEATAFDNGSWVNPQVHEPALDVTLIYVPGALLRVTGEITPDYDEVCRQDGLNVEAYYHLYERRILPGLLAANKKALAEGRELFVTLPGLGCGQFSGEFGATIHDHLQVAVERLLAEHGQELSQIKAIWYDNFDKEAATKTINGIDFLVRPLKQFDKPQLCYPAEYGDKYQNCHLVSLVAWDHVSLPGNDYWTGARYTDDGVKAAASNTMELLTGLKGKYYQDRKGFVYSANMSMSWEEAAKANQFELTVQGHLDVYPVITKATSSHKDSVEVSPALPVASEMKPRGVLPVMLSQISTVAVSPAKCTIYPIQQGLNIGLGITFPNREDRDKWCAAFLLLARQEKMEKAAGQLLVKATGNDGSLVLLNPSLGMGNLGVYKSNPARQQQFTAAPELAINLGTNALRDFFVYSLGITADIAKILITPKHNNALYFKPAVLGPIDTNKSIQTNYDKDIVRETLAKRETLAIEITEDKCKIM